MTLWYNGTTNAFYDDVVLEPPVGSVQITPEQHMAMLDGQSEGLVIQAGTGGAPIVAARVFTNDELFANIRVKRDALLAGTDWAILPDSPLSSAKKTAVTAYRKALRDLPDNTVDPANPDWPKSPI